MSTESLARWQFAITTVYHYLIVPMTIGLSVLVTAFQPPTTGPAKLGMTPLSASTERS